MRDLAGGRARWPLVLTGEPGTGKTCAALALADWTLGQRIYEQLPWLVQSLIDANQGLVCDDTGQRIRGRTIWLGWAGADLTILDELGSRDTVTDYQYETLKRAIDTRHGKPCIWISNLSLDRLAGVYDDRIASRLAEGTVFDAGAKDRRLMGRA